MWLQHFFSTAAVCCRLRNEWPLPRCDIICPKVSRWNVLTLYKLAPTGERHRLLIDSQYRVSRLVALSDNAAMTAMAPVKSEPDDKRRGSRHRRVVPTGLGTQRQRSPWTRTTTQHHISTDCCCAVTVLILLPIRSSKICYYKTFK